MKTVILPPDAPTLMWSTRAIGYTTPAAVADLIDNSVSANATEIDIEFMSGDAPYFSILDNGDGMSASELRQAMKYGSGNPLQNRATNDLGRFGLGLKTASLSQCRKLTVISKKNGETSAYCWDLDHVFEVEKWELIELDSDDIQNLPQMSTLSKYSEGTIVLWNNLDKIFAGDNDKDAGLLIRIREVEGRLLHHRTQAQTRSLVQSDFREYDTGRTARIPRNPERNGKRNPETCGAEISPAERSMR